MKKRALSLILALVLCLGLLPTAALAAEREYININQSEYADVVLSAEEAARDYGIVVSPSHIDFGTSYLGEEIEPGVITITNNSDYYVIDRSVYRPENMAWFSYKLNGRVRNEATSGVYSFETTALAPGESKDIHVSFGRNPHPASGPDRVDLYVFLGKSNNYQDGYGGEFIKLYIEDVLTIDYEIKDPDKEVSAGDIKWDLSTTALDLGVSNVTKRSNYLSDEYLAKSVTVTNRGSRPMRVESRLDTSGCSWTAIEYIISGDYPAGEYLRPGESTDITIKLQRSSWYETGTIEGCKLNLTAYYPDYPESREENTLTASIPITAKFLSDGGHVIENKGIDRGDTVRAFDAQGNELTIDGAILVAREGEAVTFVVVPSDGFYVSELRVDNENVGAVDHYTFTNIQSSHEIDYYVGRGPAPYTPYVPGQPPVTPADPTEQKPSETPSLWAQATVALAIESNILPAELQGSYMQPITRAEFCTLADNLYTAVKGSAAPVDPAVAFTDAADPAILRMASAGVVKGIGDNKFGPDGQLTREQAAAILVRLGDAVCEHLYKAPVIPDGTASFADNASISGWALKDVGRISASGIMNGIGDNQFSPQTTYTREQAVATIMRLYDLLEA